MNHAYSRKKKERKTVVKTQSLSNLSNIKLFGKPSYSSGLTSLWLAGGTELAQKKKKMVVRVMTADETELLTTQNATLHVRTTAPYLGFCQTSRKTFLSQHAKMPKFSVYLSCLAFFFLSPSKNLNLLFCLRCVFHSCRLWHHKMRDFRRSHIWALAEERKSPVVINDWSVEFVC